MAENETLSGRQEKLKRVYENFLADLGPVQDFVEDPKVTDIKIPGTGEIIVEKFGVGKVFTDIRLPPERVEGIILSASAMMNIPIDYSRKFPKLECVLPKPHRLRFTGLLQPAVDEPQIAMRRPSAKIFSLEEYLENGQMERDQYDLVCKCIEERKNILVGGSTGSGKTTFTKAILKKMAEYTPKDCFYIVEDVPELQCPARDVTFINATRENAAEAVREALRWSPNRIIFGELRYGETAEELINAWNTGHTGNVTTIHADTAGSMLLRVEEILSQVIKGKLPDLTKTIHLCVHLKREPGKPPVVDEALPITAGTGALLDILKRNDLA